MLDKQVLQLAPVNANNFHFLQSIFNGLLFYGTLFWLLQIKK